MGKKSREQFEIRHLSRLIVIHFPSPELVKDLSSFQLSPGVSFKVITNNSTKIDIEDKIWQGENIDIGHQLPTQNNDTNIGKKEKTSTSNNTKESIKKEKVFVNKNNDTNIRKKEKTSTSNNTKESIK